MKIAVIGAGNAGCAVAGDMAYRGLDVTLIKTSNAMHDDNFEFLENNNGKMTLIDFGVAGSMNPDELEKTEKNGFLSCVTRDLSVVKNMDIIIIYVQTNYHEDVIKKISNYLVDGQILIINPGYLSTAYVLKHCNKNVTVVEAQSSFIDGRIIEPGKFKVGFRNVRNPLGVYPRKDLVKAKEKLSALGFPFVYVNNVVGAALHNPNMIVHTIGSIMAIPMIDSMGSDFCMYHRSFTSHVWNVLEKLDSEKMDVLEKLGLERISYVEACKIRNSLDDNRDAKDVFFGYASMPTRAKGPINVNSRYITEDVPQGLVLLESLGNSLNIATPIATSLIEIASAALNRDFRSEGRTPEKLGVDNLKRILNDIEL